MAELSRVELRESQNPVTQLTAQIEELPDKVNSMSDFRDFQDAQSVCSSWLFVVPMQPCMFPSRCVVHRRD